MRAVVQRVAQASVEVEQKQVAAIGRGLLVLASFGPDDGDDDIRYMAEKIAGLRVFEDEAGKMNLCVADVGGEILAVPNFTIHGDCRKGRRPSFSAAAPADQARQLFDRFLDALGTTGVPVRAGIFGAHMHVCLINDGPVTLLLDSKRLF